MGYRMPQGFALGGHRGMGIPLTAGWACCSSVNIVTTYIKWLVCFMDNHLVTYTLDEYLRAHKPPTAIYADP